jgi:CheY-like chemotaxis protein
MNSNKDEHFRVLVVEDIDFDKSTQCRWLESYGYEVVAVDSAAQAISYLNTNAKLVDIALVDMRLEEENSGLQVIEYIHENCSWISAIIITAHPDLLQAAECMKAGACGYIIKGTTPPNLTSEILNEACFRRASLSTLEMVQSCLTALNKCLGETRRDVISLEKRLADREAEITSLQNRVKVFLNQ